MGLLITVMAGSVVASPAGASVGSPAPPASTAPAGETMRAGSVCIVDPSRLAAGPDGAVWFTSPSQDAVSRVDPTDGTIATFVDPRIDNPRGIVAGPDGALWFTSPGNASIGRITTDGVVSSFGPLGTGFVPLEIAVGADGALWFTGNESVGRITPAGAISTFADPELTPYATDLTPGADGAMWFTNAQDRSIGRVTETGAFSFLRQPEVGSPNSITAGPDGAMWFTTRFPADPDQGVIGRIGASGEITTFRDPSITTSADIVGGPDGALWFSSATHDTSAIGRLTVGGSFSSFTGSGLSGPTTLIVGPGDDLWFVNGGTRSIGRMSTSGRSTSYSGDCVRAPKGLAAGAGGDMWFTSWTSQWSTYAGASLGRVSATGEVTEVVSPLLDRPSKLVRGSDGAMWFANSRSVGRVDDAGSVTVPTAGTSIGGVVDITNGPDGAIWFTDVEGGRIGRLTVDGSTTMYSGIGVSRPSSIVAGSDGALWFANLGNDSIGRITTAGVVTNVASGGDIVDPRSMTAGPDGALWFVTGDGRSVIRLTTGGVVTAFSISNGHADGLTAGPDGWLWFNDVRDRSVGRISTSGVTGDVEGLDLVWPNDIATGSDGGVWVTESSTGGTSRSLLRIEALGSPGRPTSVAAVAGRGTAAVTWAPGLDGTSPISSYTASLTPGGASCTRVPAETLQCTFSGLTPGQPHTFTVTATSALGVGAPATSEPVVPTSGSTFHDVAATRLLDSRTTNGGWNGPLPAGSPRQLQVTGRAGIPPDASAVVLNVAVTGVSVPSYVSVYPNGSPRPSSSSVNVDAGDTRANLVTVALGTGGQVSFANAVGSVDVVADVVGYYDDGSGAGMYFNAIAPQRAFDSRDPASRWGGRALAAGETHGNAIPIKGQAGVPPGDDVTAVVLNLTATQATADTFLTVWSEGLRPSTSSLNVRVGDTVANLVVVPIEGWYHYMHLANAVGSVHVVVDLVGWFSTDSGDRFHPIAPTRILDDRNGTGVTGPWGPAQTRSVSAGGVGEIAQGATSVAANVTVTGSNTQSFVSAFPHGSPRPVTSTLNFEAGQTIANASYVGVGNGQIDLYNHLGSVDVITDVSGWFAPY